MSNFSRRNFIKTAPRDRWSRRRDCVRACRRRSAEGRRHPPRRDRRHRLGILPGPGLAVAREDVSGKVKVTVLENITQMQDGERLFRQLSTQGHKLIFGTTFSHFASLKKLAPTLKKSHFECCAGIEASDNLGVFEARHYEGTYLTGIAAGRMTKSNILGWVGAFPVPQVIYSLNAFMLERAVSIRMRP